MCLESPAEANTARDFSARRPLQHPLSAPGIRLRRCRRPRPQNRPSLRSRGRPLRRLHPARPLLPPPRTLPLTPDTVETRTLQSLVEDRRKLVGEQSRLINRLTDQLKRFYPRILTWFGDIATPLIAAPFPTAQSLQNYTGVSPVVERSGRQCWIHCRHACPRFVRQTIHEWAMHSIPYCQWARDYCQQQRARGKSTHVAVRALAFKWLRILYRCWQNHAPYSDAHYQHALAKRRPASSPTVQIQRQSVAGFFKLATDYS